LGYIVKPFQKDQVKAALEMVIYRNEMEKRLQQAQKMEAIGTLAGGIAHEFNNLLMGIQWGIELMLNDISSTHPRYKILKNIEKRIDRGAQLTARLLGYARGGKYQLKSLNLNEVVNESSDAFERINKGTTIRRELADDLFAIMADHGQIEQVLLNIFVNAVEAMPGGEELVLKTMNVTNEDIESDLYTIAPGRYVQLSVTDTGIGMEKGTLERLFNPFFTTKEMANGAGLGLSCVYGIIKNHCGYINVASQKGRGTTVSIYLPATEREVEKTMEASEQNENGTSTLLFVNDEEMVLEVGVEALRASGYSVLEARSGREAVETYKANSDKIDLVILDIVMPDMDGGEVFDRIKKINPNAKVVLSSGYDIDSQATDILERGCDGFIQKPFHAQELFTKIGNILDK
jgi:nitrogen-specific signal transduction histidine kinase